MRIHSHKTLKTFWEKHPDARPSIETWYATIETNRFNFPSEITSFFKDADTLKNNRIVFDICNNKYRLIVKFEYSINQLISDLLAFIKNKITRTKRQTRPQLKND